MVEYACNGYGNVWPVAQSKKVLGNLWPKDQTDTSTSTSASTCRVKENGGHHRQGHKGTVVNDASSTLSESAAIKRKPMHNVKPCPKRPCFEQAACQVVNDVDMEVE